MARNTYGENTYGEDREGVMVEPKVVSREEWREEREALLAQEKAVTRARDQLAEQRRALPMVEVDKEYLLEGPHGQVRLADLFEGRRQLIVYHFMWRADLGAGCPTCSMVVDSMAPVAHLHAVDTSLVAVTRGPWAEVAAFRERMGWRVPFYSSLASDFNYDFHVTLDPEVAPLEYNYRPVDFTGEVHGLSVFFRHDDGRVLHSYSTYARGCEQLLGPFNLLDMTPLGRQEEAGIMHWVRHHDRYAHAESDDAHCH